MSPLVPLVPLPLLMLFLSLWFNNAYHNFWHPTLCALGFIVSPPELALNGHSHLKGKQTILKTHSDFMILFFSNDLKGNSLSKVPMRKLSMFVGIFVYMAVFLCYPIKM